MIKYKQLSLEEREKIYIHTKNNKSFRQIAKLIDRSPSTVSREISRNNSLIGYLPDRANSRAAKVKCNKQTKLANDYLLKEYVLTKLIEGKWSPEAITGQGNLKVSTIACKFSPEEEFVAIKHFPRFCNFL